MSKYNGGRNFVPSKKPKYVPKGCQRCATCNRIVAEGAKCDCSERAAWDGARPVTVSHFTPSKRKYEKAAERRPRVYTFRSAKDRNGGIPVRREQSMERFCCQRCGSVFDGARIGRKPKYCPACRVDVRKEYNRERSRRNRDAGV